MEFGGGVLGEFELFLFINNFDMEIHRHNEHALSIVVRDIQKLQRFIFNHFRINLRELEFGQFCRTVHSRGLRRIER